MPGELGTRQIISFFPSPRWQSSTFPKEHISTFVPGIVSQADDTSSKHKKPGTLYDVDYIITIDGSASAGTRNGCCSSGSKQQMIFLTVRCFTNCQNKGEVTHQLLQGEKIYHVISFNMDIY